MFVCFLNKSGRWCFAAVAATGSLLGSLRKLTVNSRPKIKMLIAAPPHVNPFLARVSAEKKKKKFINKPSNSNALSHLSVR